jgi:hypothetical protein
MVRVFTSTWVEIIVIVTAGTGLVTKFPALNVKPALEEQHSSTFDPGPTPQQNILFPQGDIGSKAFVLPIVSLFSF